MDQTPSPNLLALLSSVLMNSQQLSYLSAPRVGEGTAILMSVLIKEEATGSEGPAQTI